MSLKEAVKLIEEEIRINEMNGDYREADYLKEFKEALPKIYDSIKRVLGGGTANAVIYYIANEHIEKLRRFLRRVGRDRYIPRFVTIDQVLNHIIDFSAKRNFRYGINERYIAKNLKTYEVLVEAYLDKLKEDGLIFKKSWKGNVYVFPTIKARYFHKPSSQPRPRKGSKR